MRARLSVSFPFSCIVLSCLLLLLSATMAKGQDDAWIEERNALFTDYGKLLSEKGPGVEVDSMLDHIMALAIAKNDTIGQLKSWVGKVNLVLNNERLTDSLCDKMYSLMPDYDHRIWTHYYRYRSVASSIRGEYVQQTKYLDSAVVRSTMSGDSATIGYIHTEMSLAYQDVTNYKAALASAHEALGMQPNAARAEERAYVLRNIGICHNHLEDVDSARHYYQQARNIYAEAGNLGEEMYTFALVGELELNNEKYSKAKSILDEVATTLFSPENRAYTLGPYNYIYVWLSEANLALGNQQEAIENAKIAYQVTDSLNQEVNRLQALRVLIKAELGPSSLAKDHFDEYIKSRNELYEEENEEAILEFERKYKAKEAEQKVLLLQREAQEAEIEKQNTRFWIFITLALILGGGLVAGILALRSRIRTRQKIDQLNLKALQLQINPHFFFNVLNSISNFIGLNDQKSAHFFLTRFAKLMRQTLEYSREDWVELEKELDFLRNYLELEQLRSDTFDYEIDCPDALLKSSVPPMMLQPFAENCVVHAFNDEREEKGKIKIVVKKIKSGVQVEIEDNGQGIAETKPNSEGSEKTSLAIGILEERLAVYGRKSGQVSIEKAFPDKIKSPGTRVTLSIPVH